MRAIKIVEATIKDLKQHYEQSHNMRVEFESQDFIYRKNINEKIEAYKNWLINEKDFNTICI